MKKLLATAIGSALLGAGTVATLTPEENVTTLQTEKNTLLQDNIWKDVRLGEAPEWDISVVSSKEMTDAYVAVANELNAKTDPNLYTALREKAVEMGVECITK